MRPEAHGRSRPAAIARRVLGWPARVVLDRRFSGLGRQIDEKHLDLVQRLDQLRTELRDGAQVAEAPTDRRPYEEQPAAEFPAGGQAPAVSVVNLRGRFDEEGYVVVPRLLGEPERRTLLAELRARQQPAPLDWVKGRAASSRLLYEVATHPPILDRVCEALGPDVIVWGASVVERPPGAAHAWHADIESAAAAGRTATVWLGLEHTTPEASLTVASHSHRLGVTIQEEAAAHGKRRGEASDDEVERWAKARDDRSLVVHLPAVDGDAVVFDGRLWHSSRNRDPSRTRTALLLQYATPDTPIRIPDFNQLEWPFRWLEAPRPPCLLVRGEAPPDTNRIVAAPIGESDELRPRLTTHVQRLPVPFSPAPSEWRPYPLFHGSGPDVSDLSCHISALAPGSSPHPPHRHPEEEILLVLHGEVDLVLPDRPPADGGPRERLRRGQLAYYPSEYPHTLEVSGDEPANYLMFKWRMPAASASDRLRPGIHDLLAPPPGGVAPEGVEARIVFEGATAWLRRPNCHVTTLAPGAGYEPHLDAYDVAIVTLHGEVETLGRRIGPDHVVFYAAGEPHGMRNPGEAPARYAVFELHGSQGGFRLRTGEEQRGQVLD
jgi:mannose-6-phosphate isomerase-like protein (cupin superfamily)